MRHRKRVAKLNRQQSHRKATLSSMVTSLFEHEMINTTHARARELRRVADSLITFAKRGDLHARRMVLKSVADKRIVSKLFDELGPRYAERSGGYTRLIKTDPRRGDGAPMCFVELVDRPEGTRSTALSEETESVEDDD